LLGKKPGLEWAGDRTRVDAKMEEGWNLQFRTEVFNLPNHLVFGNPNASFGNANFGKIKSTAGIYTPRQIQFALKLLY
jgi:hypothetical protein